MAEPELDGAAASSSAAGFVSSAHASQNFANFSLLSSSEAALVRRMHGCNEATPPGPPTIRCTKTRRVRSSPKPAVEVAVRGDMGPPADVEAARPAVLRAEERRGSCVDFEESAPAFYAQLGLRFPLPRR